MLYFCFQLKNKPQLIFLPFYFTKMCFIKSKPFLFACLYFVLCFTSAKAQEQDFNKWSIEASTGFGKPISPFAPKYFSSKNNTYFAFNKINHFDIGTRYMISPYFGIRMGVTYVNITNASGSNSLPFETELYKIDIQGVINMGHVLNFDQFTSRLGLLAHFGLQFSKLKIKENENAGKMDSDGGFIIGITPQYKISDRIVFNADFSYTGNFRQHLNWDGSYAANNKNLFGIMHDLTIGITYYIGKHKQHADWYWNNLDLIKTQKMLEYEAKIKDLQKDTDKDDIPDYLDLEKNTPAGSIVDSKGRAVIKEKTSPKNTESIVANNSNLSQKDKDFTAIFENGNNEVYFDFNQVNPNKDSKKKIVAIIAYMKKYPESKATLNGYTDNRGGEELNKRLGLRRSQKVKEIIELYGVDPSRISLVSKGIDELMTEGKNDLESLALARRVVIVLQ